MSVWVYLLLLYPFVGVFNLIEDLFLLFMHGAGLYSYMYACVQNCLSLTDLLCNLFHLVLGLYRFVCVLTLQPIA